MEETRAYRVYISDAIWLYGDSKRPAIRWIEAIKKDMNDSRTAEEIAADVIRSAGLTVRGGEEE